MTDGLFWLSEAQMGRLRPLLPADTRGVLRVDDRRVISGIVHVLRSGCPWRHAPSEYGPRKTLYNRFVRWAMKGVWQHVFDELSAAAAPPAKVLLDATYVKAHRCAAGGKGGSGNKQSVVRAAAGPPRSTRRPTPRASRSASISRAGRQPTFARPST